VLTVKVGSGLSRTEVELPVDPSDADSLWAHTEGRRLEKTRHRVLVADGTTAEVDVFGGALAGLCVVEVEFTDEASARAFTPPPWFARELTGDHRWSNASLACSGVPSDVRGD
jgi:CYTH domain-containing protein